MITKNHINADFVSQVKKLHRATQLILEGVDEAVEKRALEDANYAFYQMLLDMQTAKYDSLSEWLYWNKVSQFEFAQMIGVTQPYVNKIICGKTIPSQELAVVIHEKTGLPLHMFHPLYGPNDLGPLDKYGQAEHYKRGCRQEQFVAE